MSWQVEHIANAERMIAYARSTMPGQIGAVPLRMAIDSCDSADYPDVPLEALGERPVIYSDDRHRVYEEEFNSLVLLELGAGNITQQVADEATANFHGYMMGYHHSPPSRQTSPRFYQ